MESSAELSIIRLSDVPCPRRQEGWCHAIHADSELRPERAIELAARTSAVRRGLVLTVP